MMKLRYWHKPQRAFTLVEMLVGLVILSVGVLGFVSMMIVQIRGNRGARNTNDMATLVQSTVENMSGLCWDDVGTDLTSPSTNGMAAGGIDMQGPYNRLGQLSGTGTGPYHYYRYVVVCSSSTAAVTAATTPAYCGTISSTNRPAELACSSFTLSTREKVIRVLYSWRDSDGKCHWKSTDTLTFDWDGPTEICS